MLAKKGSPKHSSTIGAGLIFQVLIVNLQQFRAESRKSLLAVLLILLHAEECRDSPKVIGFSTQDGPESPGNSPGSVPELSPTESKRMCQKPRLFDSLHLTPACSLNTPLNIAGCPVDTILQHCRVPKRYEAHHNDSTIQIRMHTCVR